MTTWGLTASEPVVLLLKFHRRRKWLVIV